MTWRLKILILVMKLDAAEQRGAAQARITGCIRGQCNPRAYQSQVRIGHERRAMKHVPFTDKLIA